MTPPEVGKRFYVNSGNSHWSGGLSLDMPLTAGDNITVQIKQVTGSSIYIITGNYISVFNGHLIL
jgi:hypothetical protein